MRTQNFSEVDRMWGACLLLLIYVPATALEQCGPPRGVLIGAPRSARMRAAAAA